MSPSGRNLVALGRTVVAIAATACSVGGATSSPATSTAPTDAGPGDATTSSGPEVIATGLVEPMVLAVDDGRVYFTQGNGSLSSVSVHGGPITTLIDRDVVPNRLALTPDEVLVVLGPDGVVHAIPKAGGSPPRARSGTRVSALTAAHGTAYWVEGVADTFVVKSSLEPLGHLLGSANGCCPGTIAATTDRVYVAAISPMSLPRAGGDITPEPVAGCGSVLADDAAAYCVNARPDKVLRVEKNGTTTELTSGFVALTAAMDDDALYLANDPNGRGTIKKIPKTGGPASVFSTEGAHAIAAGADAVYAELNGTLRRIPK